eukprot:GEMP01007364.1.p1 GENE.GEMP01007364.1~~GEMP01007364.1.p1  ORF type:complete len:774 (+),score=218.57 GEMP01007364.1:211-2532(+)
MPSATSSVNDIRTWTLGTFDLRNELGPSNSKDHVSTFMRRFLSRECRSKLSRRNHESDISQMDARLFQLEESVKHLESELISSKRQSLSATAGDALQKKSEDMDVSAENALPAEMTFGVREDRPSDSTSVLARPAADHNASAQATQGGGADKSAIGVLQFALVAECSNNDELECMIKRLEEDLRASSDGIVRSSTKDYFDKSPQNAELRRILLHSREAELVENGAVDSRENQLVPSRGNNVDNLQRSLALVQQKRQELQTMIAQLDTDIQVTKAEAASPKTHEGAQDRWRFATDVPESSRGVRVVDDLQRMFSCEQQRRMDLERKVKRLESLLTVSKSLTNVGDSGVGGRGNSDVISLTSAAPSSNKPRVVDDLQRKFTLEQQKRQEAENRAKRLERELAAVTHRRDNGNEDDVRRAAVNSREEKLQELQRIKDKLEAELTASRTDSKVVAAMQGDEILSAKTLERAMARERDKQCEVEQREMQRLPSEKSKKSVTVSNSDYCMELSAKEEKERELESMVKKLEQDIAKCKSAMSAQKKQSEWTYDAMKRDEKLQKNQRPEKGSTRTARAEKGYLGELSSVPSTQSSSSRVGSGHFFDNDAKKSLLKKYGLGESASSAPTKSASTPRLVLPQESPHAKLQAKEPDKWNGMAIRPEFWLQELGIGLADQMTPTLAAHSTAHTSPAKQKYEEATRPPMSTAQEQLGMSQNGLGLSMSAGQIQYQRNHLQSHFEKQFNAFQAESDPFYPRRQPGRRFQGIGQMFFGSAAWPPVPES